MVAGPDPVRCGQIQKAIPYRLDRHRFRTIYTVRVVGMSNQRFFKIVCFRFHTNVPQKIEYIPF
jgi:hypothetical protein